MYKKHILHLWYFLCTIMRVLQVLIYRAYHSTLALLLLWYHALCIYYLHEHMLFFLWWIFMCTSFLFTKNNFYG